MKWITRAHIKVDRVACPWLIRRFIDPEAQFLFVEESQLLEIAARENAIPFDAPRLSEVTLNHRGMRCSFEAIVEDYQLQAPGAGALGLDCPCSGRQRAGAGVPRRNWPAGYRAGFRGDGPLR